MVDKLDRVEVIARAMVRGSRPSVDPDKLTPAPRGSVGLVPIWKLYEHMAQEVDATLPTTTEDARERVKVLEEALEPFLPFADWFDGMSLPDDYVVQGLHGRGGSTYLLLGDLRRARTALDNKQIPLSLSDVDAGNPKKSAPPALGNKETDRHG